MGHAFNRHRTAALAGLVACAVTAAATLLTLPSAGRLEAHERSAAPACHTEQVELDQGYGVTRIAERRICDER